MFNYPTLQAVPVKGYRFYETPSGNFYPSVTTVLGQTMPEEKAKSLKKWQDALGALAHKKTKDAADHGTAVHLLIERFLKQEELFQGEKFSPQNISAFNALKLKLKNIEKLCGLEVSMYSDVLQLAGRCDCIGVYRGELSIIDFKTSGRVKNSSQVEDYRLQLTAYAIMHNELFDTDIKQGIILMSSESGFPQEFRISLDDYVEPLMMRIQEFYDKFYKQLGE
jgi:ATP-dependent exoDNAse (exonuclease V) beta subunit